MTNIQRLRVENYKGVRQIELTPEGALVIVAGGNGEGKSSFIDAIAEIIDPKGVKLTSKPIRDGAKRATAELVTDDFIATRTWTKDGDPGKLVVKTHDGAQYSSAADFMRKVTGAGLFDPIAFVNLPDKEQRQQLLARVELPFDLDELDAERKRLYSERTDVNREVARSEAQLAGLAEPDADLPGAEVSAADVLERAEAARRHNAEIEAADALCDEAQQASVRAEREMKDAEVAFQEARERAKAAAVAAARQMDAVAELPERMDIDSITAQLRDIEAINARVREAARRAEVLADIEQRREAAERITTELDSIDEKKRAALADAEFPVAGLSVDETGVTVDGIPFRQVNTAKQRAVAFELLTAGEPELRLAQIKDGDLLDAETLAEVRRVAEARGFTVLIERDRDESREIGFVIHEGALA